MHKYFDEEIFLLLWIWLAGISIGYFLLKPIKVYHISSTFRFFFFNQQFITRGARAVRGNYLVATIHWWADNMKNGKEKEKKKKKKFNYASRIDTLLYSTFERVPVVFYRANLYWNGYTSKDNYSCSLDDPLCNSCIWRHEDMACLLWWLLD